VANHDSDRGTPRSVKPGRGHRPAQVREVDGDQAIATYLFDMTGQLESMARVANFQLLAYLLAMARAEAESLVVDPPDDAR
jgi:hypothetical protein